MKKFDIGVIVDCFRLPTYEAVKKAAQLGAKGLQLYCASGENAPENLSTAKRRELLDFVKSNGLVFSALCGDLGKGFTNPELNPELIEKSKRIMELAKELETDIVTTHIGVVPADPNHDRFKIMQAACKELADFADSIGSHFAIETGPETAKVLRGFLDTLDSKGVAVNLDPANLVMVIGDDPVQAVYELKDYIVHTHAKDGIKLAHRDPEATYSNSHPILTEPKTIKYFEEVPLGTGGVPFAKYLKALEDIGYNGYLTIEREVGDNPEADIKTAIDFLNKTMEEN